MVIGWVASLVAPFFLLEKQIDGLLDKDRLWMIMSNLAEESRALFIPLLESFNLALRSQNEGLHVTALLPPVLFFFKSTCLISF